MIILVTGGLGFIGSHTVIELLNEGHEIIIVDNLINSDIRVVEKIEKITNKKFIVYIDDISDSISLSKIFANHSIDLVIHFAGLKSVIDSVNNPLYYYQQNLNMSMNLFSVMSKYNVKKIIFSSSATVYGSQNSPVKESMVIGIGIANPYGKTKFMIEEILKDIYQNDNSWSIIILRYFNPVGAHESGLISENPICPSNNLMPIIMKVAAGIHPVLNIYGSDYDTEDGTCIRDFIHITDLAKGHIAVIKLVQNSGIHIYNLGTGKGNSVKQLIDVFEKITSIQIPYVYVSKRPGDLAINYADVSKAKEELSWSAILGLERMCYDSWLSFCKKN